MNMYFKRRDDIDYKITFAMEKLFSAYKALLRNKIEGSDLSPVQIKFILYLHKYPEDMRKVSSIALEFGLTKPTVSEAISSLKGKKIVFPMKNKKDRRISIINLTEKGKKIAETLKTWDKPIINILKALSVNEKDKIFTFLIRLMASLKKEGILKVVRICLSCNHFKRNFSPDSGSLYLCEFTGKAFSEAELKIDCFYHNPAY